MTTDHGAMLAKAIVAWGEDLPDWVRVLAEECDRTTAKAAATRIGYCPAVVSNVLANKYVGAMDTVALKVRGLLMAATIACPVLGLMPTDMCLKHQKAEWSARNPQSAILFQACRAGCPHSRIGGSS